MPRQLSPAAAAAILAEQTEEVFLACVTILHPDLPQPIRIVHNTEQVVRLVGTFEPYPVQAHLPDDTDQARPTATLQIDNVDREVSLLVRGLSGVPEATIEVVLASQPDVIEIGPLEFSVLGADIDVLTLSLQLGLEEDFLNQGVPAQSYNPTNSPGLWP